MYKVWCGFGVGYGVRVGLELGLVFWGWGCLISANDFIFPTNCQIVINRKFNFAKLVCGRLLLQRRNWELFFEEFILKDFKIGEHFDFFVQVHLVLFVPLQPPLRYFLVVIFVIVILFLLELPPFFVCWLLFWQISFFAILIIKTRSVFPLLN